jgi:hypothetical protein
LAQALSLKTNREFFAMRLTLKTPGVASNQLRRGDRRLRQLG